MSGSSQDPSVVRTLGGAPLVSVLFITYRRPELLKRSFFSFLRNTDYPNLELVVTDDGSPAAVQEEIRKLPSHKHVLCTETRGLGANTNAGLRHCTGKYILLLQDDWECHGPARYLNDAIALMEEHAELGIVKFYGAPHSADVSYRIEGASPECLLVLHGLHGVGSAPDVYSDTPHMKRRALIDLIGYYKERCRMEECELDYGMRFASQAVFRAAYFPLYYNTVFTHLGASHSFRTRSRLWHLEQRLRGLARLLKVRSPLLYKLSKSLYQAGVRSLFHVGALHH